MQENNTEQGFTMEEKQHLTSLLLDIKHEVGSIKAEQNSIKQTVADLSKLFQEQVRHDTRLTHVEKELDAIKSQPRPCHKEDRFLALEERIENTKEEAKSCKNEQNVQHLMQEVKTMKENAFKVNLTIITTLIGVIIAIANIMVKQP